MTECQDPRNSAPWVCGKCAGCLVNRWREEAEENERARKADNGFPHPVMVGAHYAGYIKALKHCADELEAAVSENP